MFKQGLESLLTLLYPPLCLHCRKVIGEPSHSLCVDCSSQLELINPEERCRYCFCYMESTYFPLCSPCRSRYPAYREIAAAFDYMGPAATLVKQMKYQDKPWLAKGISAYLYYQFLRLNWPEPDLIVPAPISWAHWFERGYNQSVLLAKNFSTFIDRPVLNCLKRKNGEFSQAGKSRRQRKELSSDNFYLLNADQIKDKIILLIDDVVTTGTTAEYCAEAMMEGFPSKIYVLTVCKADL